MGSGPWPKLEVVMGLARNAKAGERPAKAPSPKEKELSTAQFKIPPSLHQQISSLAGLLMMTNSEALGWLLSLDHPVLAEMRASVAKVNRLRKED
jgi:hypothetical protein